MTSHTQNPPVSASIPQILTPKSLVLGSVIILSLAFGFSLIFFPPVAVLGVASSLVYLAVLFFSPFLGVVAYFVFEYARLSAMFPALQALQFGKVIVIPTLVIWLVRKVISRDRSFVNDRVYALFGIWIALGLFSCLGAYSPDAAFMGTIDLLKWCVTVFLIVNLVDTLPKFQTIIWVCLLLNFKLSQFQLRAFNAGFESVSPTYSDFYISQGVGGGGGYFGNATDFGLAMAVVVPLAFFLAQSVKHWALKGTAILFTLAFSASVLRSGSRGAAVALFAIAIIYVLRSRHRFASGLLVVAFLATFWVAAPDAWTNRFVAAKNPNQDGTSKQRLDLWDASMRMVADHPLTGVGMNNFGQAFVSEYRPPNYRGAFATHNIYLQAASELGVVAPFIVVGLIFLVLRRNWDTRRQMQLRGLHSDWVWNFSVALDLSLIAYAIGGFFLTVLYYPHFYVIIALSLSLNNIGRKLVQPPEELVST